MQKQCTFLAYNTNIRLFKKLNHISKEIKFSNHVLLIIIANKQDYCYQYKLIQPNIKAIFHKLFRNICTKKEKKKQWPFSGTKSDEMKGKEFF